jgi:hypothetical protein
MIEVYVTPKELREMADTLEKKFKDTKLGEPLPKVLLDYSGNTHIYLVWNQESFDRPKTA